MPVNEQVTDSVTQVNTSTLASTPAMGMGNLLMATSQAMSNSALNAVSANQQGGIVMQSATVQGINSLMAIGTAVTGRGAEGILEKG
jgi:hypothetical protein